MLPPGEGEEEFIDRLAAFQPDNDNTFQRRDIIIARPENTAWNYFEGFLQLGKEN
jgi:hypothetical protein